MLYEHLLWVFFRVRKVISLEKFSLFEFLKDVLHKCPIGIKLSDSLFKNDK